MCKTLVLIHSTIRKEERQLLKKKMEIFETVGVIGVTENSMVVSPKEA
jgi:hypothetical protein